MKHHIMIAFGVLMAAIFSYQGAIALTEPGIGGKELYMAGGLILAAWLIYGGLAEWRAARGKRGE